MRLRCSIFRGLTSLLLASLFLLLTGCGSIRISGALNTSNVQIVTGTISAVQLTVIFGDKGTLIDVTIVTLLMPPGTNVLTFCGNQASRFTMSSAVQVSFTTTQACSNLLAVTLH
jgi:hypothetical protein